MALDGAEQRVRLFFGTPVLSVQVPEAEDLNRELAALILGLERTSSSVRQSNQGGWQSEKTLHLLHDPPIRKLLSWIDIGIFLVSSEMVGEKEVERFPRKWRISAWANVNRTGHFNGLHYHEGGFWSGVYYVAAESDGSGSGAILLHSPTQAGIIAANIRAPLALQKAFRQEIGIEPRPGILLIFPSWLEHSVNPHAGKAPRISVAFDVSF